MHARPGSGPGSQIRGLDQHSGVLPLYVDLEFRGQTDHPLQSSRQMTDEALAALSGSFSALYANRMGRLQQDNQDGDSATIKMKH